MRYWVFLPIALALMLSLGNCDGPFYISQEELEEFFASRTTTTTGYVYATQSNSTVAGYRVDSETGMLSALPNSPFGTSNGPSFVISDPDNRFLYVTNGSPANSVWGYRIAENGVLKALPANPVAAGTSPSGIAPDPRNRFAHVAFSTVNGELYSYRVDSNTGSFTQTGGPFGMSCTPRFIVTDPTGRYLYASDANVTPNPYIRFYSIDQGDGSLSELGGQGSPLPLAAGAYVNALAIDPAGRFLYTMEGTSSSNNIHAYAIDQATGGITELVGSPYQLGGGGLSARGMAMDSKGRYLFVASAAVDNSIYSYSIASSGDLIPAGSLGAANGPRAETVDPLDKFVYVGSDNAAGGGRIYIFRIGSGGSLTQIGGSPIGNVTPPIYFGTAMKETAESNF